MPLLLLILPWVAAVAALAVGRRRRAAAAVGLVAVAALAALVVLAMSLPGDPTTAIFGRTLTLTSLARGLLLLIYGLISGLLVLHWFRPVSPSFAASAVAVLSPLAAALLIAPPGLALALLAVALALLAIALTGGRAEAAGAAWRAFLLGILGLLPLLWVAWAQATGQADGAALPLALLPATLLLLGGFPFHSALRGLARWSPPGALALALGPAQVVVVALLFGLLDLAPAARAAAEFQTALRGSAMLSALLGAFLMARERTWRGALGGALLLDAGGLTLAALAPGAAGLAVALAALVGRTASLLLVALGLSRPADAGRSGILRTILLLYGCLSLLGLPLTPGFAGRWAQLSLLGAAWPWAAVVVLAALGAAGWALWRVWRDERETTTVEGPAVGQGEPIAALILLGLAALLGLFPGLLTALAARLAG